MSILWPGVHNPLGCVSSRVPIIAPFFIHIQTGNMTSVHQSTITEEVAYLLVGEQLGIIMILNPLHRAFKQLKAVAFREGEGSYGHVDCS